jgi:site-specific recombinase XerD
MDPDPLTLPQTVPAHPEGAAGEPAAPRLMVRLREALRVRHYSLRTEQAYTDWAKRYIRFHGLRHPMEMGSAEVMAFLTYLAAERGVSSSTQSQAKAALLFLYRQVLGIDLPWTGELISAKSTRRLPVVLTPREVEQLLHELNGTMWRAVAARSGCPTR